MATKQYFLRENLVNIRNGKKVIQNYNGEQLSTLKSDKHVTTLLNKKLNLPVVLLKSLRDKLK